MPVTVSVPYASGVFTETLLPPVPLVVFGAGQDVLPVVELANRLGWRTEVVDPQGRPASRTRFAIADKVTLARPQDVATHVTVTLRTMALVMSHNYSHDLAFLRFLLASPVHRRDGLATGPNECGESSHRWPTWNTCTPRGV